MELDRRAAVHFRNELRDARAAVLADAEAYAKPLHALERLGRFLEPRRYNLGRLKKPIRRVARESDLCACLPQRWPQFHRPFENLFELLREARNDAMHVGALARHLTTYAVEICLILEDALSQRLLNVSDYMVRSPVTVARWQPVSVARRHMLENSFTYLPVEPGDDGEEWVLVADHHVARYKGPADGQLDRLSTPVGEALTTGQLKYTVATTVDHDDPIDEVIREISAQPVIVLDGHDQLAGILTAFDVL